MHGAFEIVVVVVALLSGAIASVAGFGIGSLLTPTLAFRVGTKLAVAAVSVPHLTGTALRFRVMRSHLDRRVLWSFGIMSAAGGLAGAILHNRASSPALTFVFAALLVFAGITGLTGLAQRMRFGRRTAWVAGALSGAFGGLVGNQGGIRSAALLGFDIPRDAFVGTATAIALFVDAARIPVYFASNARDIAAIWPLLLAASVGVVAGTVLGARLLRHIPEQVFRRVVALIILALGIYMLFRAPGG